MIWHPRLNQLVGKLVRFRMSYDSQETVAVRVEIVESFGIYGSYSVLLDGGPVVEVCEVFLSMDHITEFLISPGDQRPNPYETPEVEA